MSLAASESISRDHQSGDSPRACRLPSVQVGKARYLYIWAAICVNE